MPITVHPEEQKLYRDVDHWKHVMEQLFIPAIELAGFAPIKPFTTGSSMIHARIVQHLATAPLVLCDLSQHNANVMFELGVRTSVDKPIVLVKDEHTKLPFDIGGINTHEYSSGIESWQLESQRQELADHIRETGAALEQGNPMWRRFGTGIVASAPTSSDSPVEARLDVLSEQINTLLRRGSYAQPDVFLSHNSSDREWATADHGGITNAVADVPGVKAARLSMGRNGMLLTAETEHTPLEDQEARYSLIEEQLHIFGLEPKFANIGPERVEFEIS